MEMEDVEKRALAIAKAYNAGAQWARHLVCGEPWLGARPVAKRLYTDDGLVRVFVNAALDQLVCVKCTPDNRIIEVVHRAEERRSTNVPVSPMWMCGHCRRKTVGGAQPPDICPHCDAGDPTNVLTTDWSRL